MTLSEVADPALTGLRVPAVMPSLYRDVCRVAMSVPVDWSGCGVGWVRDQHGCHFLLESAGCSRLEFAELAGVLLMREGMSQFSLTCSDLKPADGHLRTSEVLTVNFTTRVIEDSTAGL